MEEKVLICEDTLESVFTGIYEIYARHYNRKEVRLQVGEDENYRLFAEYVRIETDPAKAVKVMRTLRDKFGEDAYKDLCLALTTDDREKAQVVYRTVELGLSMCQGDACAGKLQAGKSSADSYKIKKCVRIMDRLSDDNVRRVMELSRAANNELMHLRGFLRFQELRNGVLYAKIGPRDNILSLLAPHFSERFSAENFVIYDHKRDQAVVHPARDEWYLVQGVKGTFLEEIERAQQDLNEKNKYFSAKEEEYQELFQFFCNKISIKERENKALQRSMLPLRFQKYMTEFMPK